jgi:CHAT domain-containing protein
VSGLRQAFQLAGAKSVVATLWSIPDAETVDVTDKLFQELATGKSDAKALQLAQQSVINARRLKHQAAHPVFWGAFCVTKTGK